MNPTEISTIYTGLKISLDDIEKRIEAELPNGYLLHKDEVKQTGLIGLFSQHRLYVRAYKYKAVEIKTKAKYLQVRLPLLVKFDLKYGKTLKPVSAEAIIIATARIKLSLSQNWKLGTNTDTVGFRWESFPKFKILGQQLPVLPMVQNYIKRLIPTLITKLDEKMAGDMSFKSLIKYVWQNMQDVMDVSDEPPVALKLTPKVVQIEHIKLQKRSLKTNIRLEMLTETFIGKNAATQFETHNTALPPLRKMKEELQKSTVFVVNYISYKEAERQVLEALKLQLAAYERLILKNIKIYKRKALLVVEIVVGGLVEGQIYVKALPKYDAKKQKFYLSEFDFLVMSNNTLLKIAEKVLHRNLAQQIKQEVETAINDEIVEILEMLHKWFNQKLDLTYIHLDSKLETSSLHKLSLVEKGLKVVMKLTGMADIFIQPMPETSKTIDIEIQ
ncbi:MAG: DUF4403 family protein [Chitinophagales bacterium]